MSGPIQTIFIGLLLENIAYGAYCVIFCLYLRIQNKRISRSKDILFYALTANFILCTLYLAADNANGQFLLKLHLEPGWPPLWDTISYIAVAIDALYICIDLISQGILIYRCWIMWRLLSVIAIPTILSIAFLGTALAALVSLIKTPIYGSLHGISSPNWFFSTVTAFFSLSLAVNALATGLIVYKILSVYREVQGFNKSCSAYPYYEKKGSQDIYPIVSILVESGMVTFIMQVVQVILYKVDRYAFPIISGIVVIFYGISTTVVLVRVDMGVDYDNETSRASHSGIVRFAPCYSNNNQGVQTLDVIEHDSRQGPLDRMAKTRSV